jgi:hypothetical protein
MVRIWPEKCRAAGMLFVVFVLCFPGLVFCQQVELKTLKDSYRSGEKISVTVTNSLAGSIYTVAAGARPDMAFSNIEKKASVGWDAFPLRCRQPSCKVDYVIPAPGEIKPGASVTFLWQPVIFSNNKYVNPDPGLYRLTILYQVSKEGDARTWNWTTVRSNTFTLEQ